MQRVPRLAASASRAKNAVAVVVTAGIVVAARPRAPVAAPMPSVIVATARVVIVRVATGIGHEAAMAPVLIARPAPKARPHVASSGRVASPSSSSHSARRSRRLHAWRAHRRRLPQVSVLQNLAHRAPRARSVHAAAAVVVVVAAARVVKVVSVRTAMVATSRSPRTSACSTARGLRIRVATTMSHGRSPSTRRAMRHRWPHRHLHLRLRKIVPA